LKEHNLRIFWHQNSKAKSGVARIKEEERIWWLASYDRALPV